MIMIYTIHIVLPDFEHISYACSETVYVGGYTVVFLRTCVNILLNVFITGKFTVDWKAQE